MIEKTLIYIDCIFCNGRGWFKGTNLTIYECYCVSLAKLRASNEGVGTSTSLSK